MTDAIQKAREAAVRLRENLASFDAEVAYQLSIEGERADVWDEIDVNVEDLRAALTALDAETPATPADVGELVEPELLDQAVSFAEMWGTEQNWPHVRDAYVAAILRERAKLSPRPSFRKTIPNYPEYDNARSK